MLDLKGKICLVTGASSGIGKATALGLSQMGARVVLLCRDKLRGEATLKEIRQGSQNYSTDLLLADLSSMDSVSKAAEQFKSRYQNLHVLINNAGTYFTKRHTTPDGFEATFAVNYLSRFLLTNLLLDILKRSAPARVINVAGDYHSKGKIDFGDLQMERNYSGMRANNQCKLADVLFTYELARKLEGSGVTANCLHPGAVATEILLKDKGLPFFSKFLYRLFKPFFRSPEKGAETILFLASSKDIEKTSGQYFVDKKAAPSSPLSYDKSLAKSLWEKSSELLHIRF